MLAGRESRRAEVGVEAGPVQLMALGADGAPVDRDRGEPAPVAAEPGGVVAARGHSHRQGELAARGRVAERDRPGPGGGHERATQRSQTKHLRATRHPGRLIPAPERQVLEDRRRALRPLPHLVVAAAPDELVARRRPARRGPPAQDERAVDEQPVEADAVDVGGLALAQDGAVGQVVEASPQLRGALRVEPPQEMAHAVGLVGGHQRRPLAREVVSDRLELVQLPARCEQDVVVLERVRPEHAGGDRQRRDGGLDDAFVRKARRTAAERRRQGGRRGHRERLACHPGRADREEEGAAEARDHDIGEQLRGAPLPGPPDPDDAGRDHERDQDVGRRRVVRVDAEVARRPDAEELEAAQGADQVAEIRLLVEGADSRQPVDRRHEGRDREQREAGDEHARLRQQALWPAQKDDRGHERSGNEPHRSREAEDADERRAGRGQRQRGACAPALLERPRQERRDQREEERAGELLDPAPERVAEQDRRLGRDEDRERTQRAARGSTRASTA